MDESRSLANRKICYDALGQLRLIRSVNRTDHPLSSPRHVCPIDMLGAISLPPFPTGVPTSSVPPLVVIVVSSRYMSPYAQSTPWGAGSRCGGRLSANNHYQIVVIVSSQEWQQRIIIVRFFTSVD